MRNGFASAALLCTLTTPGTSSRRRVVTSAAMRAQARSVFTPFRRELPLIPELLPVSRTRRRDVYELTIREGLAEVLPGFEGSVVESQVQRWPTGAPYCFPGRAKLQPTLTRGGGGRVFLAGDYLGTLYTETAIQSALTAAQEAQSVLATERQAAGSRRTAS